MLTLRWPVTLLAAFALAACEQIDSADIATHGIYADLEVVASGNGTSVVRAELRAGGDLSNVSVEVVGGDRLVATQGAASRTMGRRDDVLGRIWYEASFATQAEDAPFGVAFLREAPLESAPDSAVTLPAPFAILAPEAGATFSRSQGLLVRWSPSRYDPITIRLAGPCLAPQAFALGVDRGAASIPAEMLDPMPGAELETCDVVVSVVRWREGVVDPAYGEGGRFVASQVRAVVATSAP